MRQDVIAHSAALTALKLQWLEERLAWFRSLRFGVIIHWAPYSQWDCCESWPLVPEDDWARNDDMQCWTERGKDIARFQRDYWDLARTFDPKRFDARAWAETIAGAGAKYVCFTTKHHDGFCMWDTVTTDYRITGEICPFHNDPRSDITKELFNACRDAGLGISVYFSKADWHCPDYWDPTKNPFHRGANTLDDPAQWERFVRYTHNQIRELMSDYGKIDILWLDAGWVRDKEDIRMAEMVAMARELQPGLIVANRTVGDAFEDFVTPERELPDEALPETWEACLPICSNWKYIEGEVPRSAEEVVKEIRYANERGGNFLLGIGPRPDGTFPPEVDAVMRQIGELLASTPADDRAHNRQ